MIRLLLTVTILLVAVSSWLFYFGSGDQRLPFFTVLICIFMVETARLVQEQED